MSITLEKNPDYFVDGRPYLDKIVNYIMNDDNTRLASFPWLRSARKDVY